ncbi:cTPxI [Microbotryomycetes sp. JL201]|nr:cTPxI [Microbotryomycetes sp. JL201]
MIETIYLARHGFRLSWETSVWTAPTGTPRDVPLAAHGVDQATELALYLTQGRPQDPPDVIISSPYYRCLQTAQPLSRKSGKPILVEHGLSEWYLPVKRGLHPVCMSATELREYVPEVDDQAHASLVYPSRKGESVDEIHDRAEAVLQQLVTKYDKVDGVKHLVLFSHAATGIAMSRALAGDRNLDVRSATCSVSAFKRVPEEGKGSRGGLGSWRRILNGETSFLSRGEERHWDYSYVEAYEEDGILDDGTALPTLSDSYKAPFASGKLSARVQQPAPAFEAKAVVDGIFDNVKLEQFKGKWVILLFYPMDWTFVCPTELLAFNSALEQFKALNTEVLGVSCDSVFSHSAWANVNRAEGGLGPNFKLPLVADKNHKIARDYGVLLEASFCKVVLRQSINRAFIRTLGTLRQITINDLPVGRSVDETIRLIKAFQFTDEHGEVCPANWDPDTNSSTIKPDPKGKLEYFAKAATEVKRDAPNGVNGTSTKKARLA